jgi:hypothetical protein
VTGPALSLGKVHLTQQQLMLGGAAAVAVAGLYAWHKNQGTGAAADGTDGGWGAGTYAAGGVGAGAGAYGSAGSIGGYTYDTGSTDLYNELQPEIEQIATAQKTSADQLSNALGSVTTQLGAASKTLGATSSTLNKLPGTISTSVTKTIKAQLPKAIKAANKPKKHKSSPHATKPKSKPKATATKKKK